LITYITYKTLAKTSLSTRMSSYSSSDKSECSICLEKCRINIEVLTCGHAFHIECIAKWLEQGCITCPMCRCKVKHKDSPILIGNLLNKYYNKLDLMIKKFDKFEKFARYQALSNSWSNKVVKLEEQSNDIILTCIEIINNN
jgi:hypothetical protein